MGAPALLMGTCSWVNVWPGCQEGVTSSGLSHSSWPYSLYPDDLRKLEPSAFQVANDQLVGQGPPWVRPLKASVADYLGRRLQRSAH